MRRPVACGALAADTCLEVCGGETTTTFGTGDAPRPVHVTSPSPLSIEGVEGSFTVKLSPHRPPSLERRSQATSTSCYAHCAKVMDPDDCNHCAIGYETLELFAEEVPLLFATSCDFADTSGVCLAEGNTGFCSSESAAVTALTRRSARAALRPPQTRPAASASSPSHAPPASPSPPCARSSVSPRTPRIRRSHRPRAHPAVPQCTLPTRK